MNKNKFSVVAMLWLMSVAVMQSQNCCEWLWQNTTQEQYLEQQMKALKFFNYQNQRGYERIEKGLMIFTALEDQAYQQHHSYFGTHDELSSAFYTEDQLNKLQSQYSSLSQFTSNGIKSFNAGKTYSNASLTTIHWNLWKLLRNSQRQLQILEKLIDSDYFKLSDGDRTAKVEQQKLKIQNQHHQLKAFYVQFIMLTLKHN
ncbi:hypothetical protein [Galbibacter sp.]|uniref:hypothetical protein n=1 Tax=Galbibacter sp. TaxID=2918471 RepID=UPI003A95CE8E